MIALEMTWVVDTGMPRYAAPSRMLAPVVSAANPFHWMTLVGLLLILIVIFAPRGVGHGVTQLWSSFVQRRRGS